MRFLLILCLVFFRISVVFGGGLSGAEFSGREKSLSGAGLVSTGPEGAGFGSPASAAFIEEALLRTGLARSFGDLTMPSAFFSLPRAGSVWSFGLRGLMADPIEEISGGLPAGRMIKRSGLIVSAGWSHDFSEAWGAGVLLDYWSDGDSSAVRMSCGILGRLDIKRQGWELRSSAVLKDLSVRIAGPGERASAVRFGAGAVRERFGGVYLDMDLPFDAWQSPVFKAGGEVRLWTFLTFRAGFSMGSGILAPSAGLGIDVPVPESVWTLDAGGSLHPDLGASLAFSLSWRRRSGGD